MIICSVLYFSLLFSHGVSSFGFNYTHAAPDINCSYSRDFTASTPDSTVSAAASYASRVNVRADV